MVPNGWEKHPIGNICRSIVPGRNKPKVFNGDIPWVTTPEIDGKYIPSSKQVNYISNHVAKECGAKLVPEGAVVIAAVGDLGLTAIASEKLFLNQQLHAFVCPESVHNEYIAYFLSSQKPYMYTVASKTTIPYMNKSNCESIPILLPPLPEQRKIAQILSTWDKAIATTEKLIATSQQQKKALMQQLLTGKKRLVNPDTGKVFEGDWYETTMASLFSISAGKSKSKFISDSGQYLIVDMGSISREGKLIASKKTSHDSDFLSLGQLVMPKDDIGGGQIIGRTAYIPESGKFILSDHVYLLEPKTVNSLFASYLINSWEINKQLRSKANGTAQLGLGKKDVEKQKLVVPKSLQEQQKIASVLTAADKEIEFLEAKLAHLKE
ncbi:restriction endonuclease subunit S, partial [Providencia stuartii]|uniref:restriction endonuclease subunit S n=1 Tax=Providencia stuartii TaxID=588 RepID=UPI003D7FD457